MLVSSAKHLLTPFKTVARNLLKMSTTVPSFETLSVTVPHEFVYHVEFNRPEKRNAINEIMWLEIGQCFKQLHQDENCRVIVLSGAGQLFTSGLDFEAAMQLAPKLAEHQDVARKAKILAGAIKPFQNSVTSLELCHKPVFAAVHSACVGAGVDYITAADVRYCTKDAWFQVKEVELGMAADIGTLQRLPKVIGSDSLARELCYTARKFPAAEALARGFVSQVFEDKNSMLKSVFETAQQIAAKSPVAVQGTKKSLVYSRDHSVQEGLDHIALHNEMMLQSEDFTNATVALITKQKDLKFSKL